MKLALISPKGVGMGTDDENDWTGELYGSLNGIGSLAELMSCANSPLLTIAAILDGYFNEVVYIDEEIEDIDWDTNYDVVAMSFMTQQATRAFYLAEKFKEKGCYLIAGGMHPTNSTEETLNFFDTVFVGESEVTLPQFMEDYIARKPQRVYLNSHEVNMNCVPIPRYDLLKIDKYKTIPVQISRGCPHDCEFCASTKVYGAKYRHKSVERVIGEIGLIQQLKKNPHIYFTDDNMLVKKDFSIELLDTLKCLQKDRPIRWMTHTDISVADNDEILKRLFAAGCRKLVIGFESIVPESLRTTEKWKFDRMERYGSDIKKIQSYGIGVWGTFIVGLDNDNTSVFQRVVDFTLSNNLYGAMVSVPTPFPGSALYGRLSEEERILSKNWGSYTLWNVVVKPKNMSVDELKQGFSYVLRQVYSKEAVEKRVGHFKDIYAALRRNKTEENFDSGS